MAPNPPRSRWALFAAGALGSALLGTAGIAAAQSTTATPEAAEATRPEHAGHANETALTGDTADKVTAAALAAVPGATVDRVETDADGSPYEAHLTKADGSHVTVKVDANFAVTSVDAGRGPGGREGHGKGGHGPGGGHGNESALTGDTADKVTAAALGAVPGATVDRVETDADGSPYEAHLTKADGSHVTVKVDANFAVTSVDAGR